MFGNGSAGLVEQNIGAMVGSASVSERNIVRQLHAYGVSVLSCPISKIMTSVGCQLPLVLSYITQG
ncbi:hypothetical protein A8144_00070 [Mycobacterium leprae 3125609]|nr:hypothetical protein A8144_00070 [Mycobacterium leprae 3125609]OAX72201.1 hypothetical protein A3216_00130 [Mycobacterium leprae 7935681]